MKTKLGPAATKLIEAAVAAAFQRLRLYVLGDKHPTGKHLIVRYRPEQTLRGLFNSASQEEGVRPAEDVAKTLLRISSSYLLATEEKAKAKVVNAVRSFLHEAGNRGVKTDLKTVLGGSLEKVMGEVQRDVRRIIETESTIHRNMGGADGISRASASVGIEDPTVFFVIVKDGNACETCVKLHTIDGVTPRLWKMSELNSGHFKRGDTVPSMCGIHPHCLTGNMRIHTNRGLLTVEELFRAGGHSMVAVDGRIKLIPTGVVKLVDFGQGQVNLRAATAVYDTGVQPCYEITLDSGQVLEVSEGHEMWVDSQGGCIRVRASGLKEGDRLPLLSGVGAFGTWHGPDWAEAIGARTYEAGIRAFADQLPWRVPDQVWGADRDTVAAYLRGLYQRSAHIETPVALVLPWSDVAFLREIQTLLSNYGIRAQIDEHQSLGGNPFYALSINGQPQVERFIHSIQRGYLHQYGGAKENDGAWTAKVKKIKSIGLQQTYCLTEPETNTITVNGVVTGQCRCAITTLMPGFGFDSSGRVTYKSKDWDEFAQQRATQKSEPDFGEPLAKGFKQSQIKKILAQFGWTEKANSGRGDHDLMVHPTIPRSIPFQRGFSGDYDWHWVDHHLSQAGLKRGKQNQIVADPKHEYFQHYVKSGHAQDESVDPGVKTWEAPGAEARIHIDQLELGGIPDGKAHAEAVNRLKTGGTLPPLEVMDMGDSTYGTLSNHHVLQAAKDAGITHVPVKFIKSGL